MEEFGEGKNEKFTAGFNIPFVIGYLMFLLYLSTFFLLTYKINSCKIITVSHTIKLLLA